MYNNRFTAKVHTVRENSVQKTSVAIPVRLNNAFVMLLNLASEWKSKHFKDKRILQKQKRSASERRPIYILPGVLWIFNERPSTQIEKETTKHKFRRDFLFFSLLFFSKKRRRKFVRPIHCVFWSLSKKWS